MTRTLFLACLLVAAPVIHSDMNSFQQTWVKEALDLQRELDDLNPLARASFLKTHNSYNSSVWASPVRYVDPNQSRSVIEQLEMGIRAIEYDVHTYFSMHGWFWNWGQDLLLCHGTSSHLGCSSYDRTFRDGLSDISEWIRRPENSEDVLLLYIEDHIDSGFYGQARSEIEHAIGDLILRPESGGCEGIPMDVSRAEILADGKRIILMTDGCNNGFTDMVYGGVGGSLNGYPTGSVANLQPHPECVSQDFSDSFLDEHLVRYQEDRTVLSSLFGDPGPPITALETRNLVTCGVNLVGFDFIEPHDGRLAAAVWSWAQGQPDGGGDCAANGIEGRFFDRDCEQEKRFACRRSGSRNWHITTGAGTWEQGEQLCRAETGGEYGFSVPTTPLSGQALRDARDYHAAGEVWMNYRRNDDGDWMPGNPF